MATNVQIESACRTETRPVAMKTFDSGLLDSVVDASPAQWATFTVDVITYARRIDLPHSELTRLLEILGITAGQKTIRGFDGKAIPSRGVCPVCRTRTGLQVDGRVRSHKRRGEHCPGRHQFPAADETAVAS